MSSKGAGEANTPSTSWASRRRRRSSSALLADGKRATRTAAARRTGAGAAQHHLLTLDFTHLILFCSQSAGTHNEGASLPSHAAKYYCFPTTRTAQISSSLSTSSISTYPRQRRRRRPSEESGYAKALGGAADDVTRFIIIVQASYEDDGWTSKRRREGEGSSCHPTLHTRAIPSDPPHPPSLRRHQESRRVSIHHP